ncbi:MAG: PEP-CTERM sorting domain-containing protein [Acidobacteriota bacterium]|nr:PEP-CTERM sorting domain-containing protein [Acidobacteriota bacterium]
MPPTWKSLLTTLALAVFTLVASSAVRADELLINGGFETGTFAGWTTVARPGSNGNLFIDNNNTLPLSGRPTVGPASGNFFAVTDMGGPGTYSLLQTFVVSGAQSQVILSFSLFTNNAAGQVIVNPAGLDHTMGPNQHIRVDILSAAATPFDTGAGVLANFILGGSATNGPNPYVNLVFDITALVGLGGTFQLRFAEVDNQGFLNMGVDNVSINATPAGAPVPEPATLLLLGTGLAGVAAARKRRKARKGEEM